MTCETSPALRRITIQRTADRRPMWTVILRDADNRPLGDPTMCGTYYDARDFAKRLVALAAAEHGLSGITIDRIYAAPPAGGAS